MAHRTPPSARIALGLLGIVLVASTALAEDVKPGPSDKGGPACKVVTEEAPRGGQLEISGQHWGRTPIVRIGDTVTRMLRREKDLIAVQIPRDSNGGAVTIQVDGKKIPCGDLKIIGKNR